MNISNKRTKTMLSAMKIMVVSPHPDDAELIAGGYLSMRAHSGASILEVAVCTGDKGTKIRGQDMSGIRKKEQMKASKIVGIENIQFLGMRDAELPGPAALRDRLLPIMRDFGPDIVITVDPCLRYEAHSDHITTGFAALEAILFYQFPNVALGNSTGAPPSVAVSPTNNPDVIINIDKFMANKIAALKAYKSQPLNIDKLVDHAKSYGRRIKCNYGEPFKFLYMEELHMNGLA